MDVIPVHVILQKLQSNKLLQGRDTPMNRLHRMATTVDVLPRFLASAPLGTPSRTVALMWRLHRLQQCELGTWSYREVGMRCDTDEGRYVPQHDILMVFVVARAVHLEVASIKGEIIDCKGRLALGFGG